MKILVLGKGCSKCEKQVKEAESALKELDLQFPVIHLSNYSDMAKYSIMATPALVIDERVVSSGRILKKKDIIKILNTNL